MITTGSYKEVAGKGYITYSISFDKGEDAEYKGRNYIKLAPRKGFWRTWKKNIGKVSEEENTRYYVEQYYKQVLSQLDPEEVYAELDHSVLLCYEDSDQFCHRHIVAAWFNLLLGDTIEPVYEISIKNGVITDIRDSADTVSGILEEVIKENEDMKGFNSVRARYLFNKSEQMEELANKLEEEGTDVQDLRQCACYLRCDADEAEADYKAVQYKKGSKKND